MQTIYHKMANGDYLAVNIDEEGSIEIEAGNLIQRVASFNMHMRAVILLLQAIRASKQDIGSILDYIGMDKEEKADFLMLINKL